VKGKTESGPDVGLHTPLTLQSDEDVEQGFDENDVIAASPVPVSDPYIGIGRMKKSCMPELSPYSTSNIDLSANATPNGATIMEERVTYDSNTSLYISMNSVYQPSSSQLSALSLPSGPVLQENGEESEFEVLFLIRHYSEAVGTWLVYSVTNRGCS
jgi:hypothetical protein